jgi:NAD(P)-dependent dehydrogenase (short-subunit alcohol dehydrogenase family)
MLASIVRHVLRGEAEMGRLTGKVAVVTGGASGFGRTTAVLFASEGARVLVADLDEAGAGSVVGEIVDKGGDADCYVGDVSQVAVATAIVERVLSRFGSLHVLVNNAGIVQDRPAAGSWTIPEEMWDRVLASNLRSVYACSQAAIPALRDSGGGSIVNVASIAAAVSVGGVAYAAAKGGMVSYTRHLAQEIAPLIRVNCVSPGYMWTPMSSGVRSGFTAEQQEERREILASMSPMGRAGSAEDIARAILFFASDDSTFVTGRDLVVDGGHVIASWPRPAGSA